MREPGIGETRNNCIPKKKEVIGIKPSGESHVLAEFVGTGWSLIKNQWFFHLPSKFDEEDRIFDLVDGRKVIILPGRKLEYETKSCSKQKTEYNFTTVIELSAKHPYGKAVALFNLKSGFLEIKEEWLLLPGITLAFILSHVPIKEGYGGFTTSAERPMELMDNDAKEGIVKCNVRAERANQFTLSEDLVHMENSDGSGACGGGCGGGCGSGCSGCRSGGCRSGDEANDSIKT